MIDVETDGDVAVISLSRPECRNALTAEALTDLAAAVEASTPRPRCVWGSSLESATIREQSPTDWPTTTRLHCGR
jgi:hypothetical protein